MNISRRKILVLLLIGVSFLTACNPFVRQEEEVIVDVDNPMQFEVVGSEAANEYDWMKVQGRVNAVLPDDAEVQQFVGYVKVNIKFYDAGSELIVEDYTYINATEAVWAVGTEKDFVLVRNKIDNYDHHEIELEKISKINGRE